MAANVSHFVPPPPPGAAKYDRSKFRNGGTLLVDTQQLGINANTVTTCRMKAFGDPADPLAPAVAAPSIATNLLMAPSFDAGNNVQFRAALAISNTMVQIATPTVLANVFIGTPFNWTPPSFSSITPIQPVLKGGTFAQTYPLSGGQVRGFAKLYVPQPGLSQQGQLLSLNGGTVSGAAKIFT